MDHFNSKHRIVDAIKCEVLCSCKGRHDIPATEVMSALNAYDVLAKNCVKAYGQASVLLLDDENTHKAAGVRVLELLQEYSQPCHHIRLAGNTVVTDQLVKSIYEQSAGSALIIAVGAGSINDLGKYVAGKREIPYWSVPTAPSMNGYTSAIAAVKVKGVKRTLPATPPQAIYVDPRVIQQAPLRLRQAGFCDVLAKSVSDIDWQTESLLFNGSYCALPSAIVNEPESKYINSPEMISQGEEKAVLGLFEGLLFSGVAMSLAGSSAPASGGEHLISHFLDMRESITGKQPNLHGLQVGAGVVLSAVCYRKLAALKKEDLKNSAEEIFDADARSIPSVWGSLADEVEKQFLKKRRQLLQFDALLPSNWHKLKTLFSAVRRPDFFLELIRRTGQEMTLPSLGIAKDEFLLAAVSARTIRDRITVLDLSAHTGTLQEAAKEAIDLLS